MKCLSEVNGESTDWKVKEEDDCSPWGQLS